MGNEVILSPAPSTRAPSERSWDGTKSPVRCATAMGGVYLTQQAPCRVCKGDGRGVSGSTGALSVMPR